MGLISIIKDVVGGAGSAFNSTMDSTMWREYFESGDMSDGILMKRGEKILGKDSKNRRGDDNIINSGAFIDVQENQCMILVENGKIVELCTEPGRYQYDSSTAPSWFCGENKGIKAVAKEFLSQWSAGGQRTSTQRVYFINMGEIITKPIKWGCGDIAFHHTQVYRATGSMLELDMTLKANGEATIQITDPTKFFTMIGSQKTGTDGNGMIRVTDDGIYGNLRSGIVDHISTAISTLGSSQAVAYTAIKAKSADIKAYLNSELEREWVGKRGFGVANFTINGSPIPTDENKKQLEEMQVSFNMSQNANAMNYDVQKTMARGFENAGNSGGGANAMFGMGMAMNAMGGNFGNIQNQPMQNQTPQQNYAYQQPVQVSQPAPADVWNCNCGTQNDGAFCKMCGSRKPEAGIQEKTSATWTCSCGKVNEIDSRFCPSCGSKKPTVKKYKCDKCGWVPAEGEGETVRFCPKCGDPFNDADVTEE